MLPKTKLTKNIYLYGSPGSGKTSVGKELGKLLNMPVYDVDDHHSETVWNTTVSKKLAELGDEGFVEAEAIATMSISKENTIISLSGSNPLHTSTMNHIRNQGIVVYLDVERDEICKRLHKMKFCRIVGQSTKTLKEILDYRGEIYEKFYDVRVIVGYNETIESIAHKVVEILNKNQFFFSTRGEKEQKNHSFFDVLNQGLANDQGLFLPNYMPFFQPNEWERFLNYNFQETALRIIESFPIFPLSPQKLWDIIQESYSTFTHEKILPLHKINDNIYLMEEYYGPTASFKDLALQPFAKLFQEANNDAMTCVLVATSGDTGSAVLSAFNTTNSKTPVIVLYPYGNVSPVQEAQMIVAEGNVSVIGVKADFDYCQSSVKKIFNDLEFKKMMKEELNVDFTSANSINWGRLLPQIIYSVFGYMELVRLGVIKYNEKIDVCVPSGNFGNILGAFIAKSMGLPIERLICASNENNILTDFLKTGVFSIKKRELMNTISPAIDILNPSNLERLLSLITNKDGKKIREWYGIDLKEKQEFIVDEKTKEILQKTFYADFCDQNEVKKVIKDEFENNKILLDPHTAVGKAVIGKYLAKEKSPRMILLAGTAHYGKFPEAILDALNLNLDGGLKEKFGRLEALQNKYPKFHKELKGVLEKQVIHKDVLEADYEKIKGKVCEILKKLIKK